MSDLGENTDPPSNDRAKVAIAFSIVAISFVGAVFIIWIINSRNKLILMKKLKRICCLWRNILRSENDTVQDESHTTASDAISVISKLSYSVPMNSKNNEGVEKTFQVDDVKPSFTLDTVNEVEEEPVAKQTGSSDKLESSCSSSPFRSTSVNQKKLLQIVTIAVNQIQTRQQ
ncbi:uncharacterized protein LOC134857148 [Symsagittifera roscoffensis]|uniref:uncharacterized protein LOC134857148 n=1 Tax=Symsagittifera roscoffensis TaxID=84072 RepID=UPI00307B8593